MTEHDYHEDVQTPESEWEQPMNEHVHEWEWIYRPDGVGPRYIGCRCGEPMPSDEIFKRVQATERLSAEDARRAEHIISDFTYKDFPLPDNLQAYADILEGKDETE